MPLRTGNAGDEVTTAYAGALSDAIHHHASVVLTDRSGESTSNKRGFASLDLDEERSSKRPRRGSMKVSQLRTEVFGLEDDIAGLYTDNMRMNNDRKRIGEEMNAIRNDIEAMKKELESTPALQFANMHARLAFLFGELKTVEDISKIWKEKEGRYVGECAQLQRREVALKQVLMEVALILRDADRELR